MIYLHIVLSLFFLSSGGDVIRSAFVGGLSGLKNALNLIFSFELLTHGYAIKWTVCRI